MKRKKYVLIAGAILTMVFGGFCVQQAQADERLFTYSYEADVLPKGAWEFEQWLTGRFAKDDGDYAAWDFREEIEHGLTDKLTTALYLNFTSEYSSHVPADGTGDETEHEFEFEGVSSEWKYQLLNPYKDLFGLLAYGEVTYSGEELELEQKVVLQKNITDKLIGVANATVEEEWEFEDDETEQEYKLEFTTGLAYKFHPQWSVGVELRNIREFDEDGSQENSAWFLGPNVHYAKGNWWATLTVLPQIHGTPDTEDNLALEDYERLEVRLLVGINF